MMNIAVCDDEPVVLTDLQGRIERFFEAGVSGCNETAGGFPGDNVRLDCCVEEKDYPCQNHHRRSDECNKNFRKNMGDVNKKPQKCSIKCYKSGSELLAGVNENKFDIIFLDIKMEGRDSKDGMETARILRSRGFEGVIIFITVLAELVFDSFEVGAGDYIVKPVSDERLYAVLERTVRKNSLRRLTVRQDGEYIIIPFDDILYCEVLDKDIVIHTVSGDVSFRGSLGRLSEKLDSTFFLCHRSFAVNLRHIERVGSREVTVRGGVRVPLSRLRRQQLRVALADYMGEWL